jgi:hypothetical protein
VWLPDRWFGSSCGEVLGSEDGHLFLVRIDGTNHEKWFPANVLETVVE